MERNEVRSAAQTPGAEGWAETPSRRAGRLRDCKPVEEKPGFRHPNRYDRHDILSFDGLELPPAFVEREILGVAVDEYQHRPRAVRRQELDDASSTLPKLGLENLHSRVETVYGPLDDRYEQHVRSAIRHDGPGQLPVHVADPNWSLN